MRGAAPTARQAPLAGCVPVAGETRLVGSVRIGQGSTVAIIPPTWARESTLACAMSSAVPGKIPR